MLPSAERVVPIKRVERLERRSAGTLAMADPIFRLSGFNQRRF